MNYKKLGNTDLNVSTICLGTMTWGEQNTEEEGFEQMDWALDHGVNFWDTAEIYSIPMRKETYGETERIIGNWFEKYKKRKEVILATKVCGNTSNKYIRGGGNNFGKKKISLALEESLKRLKTDYIDLYQLHWPERKSNFFGRLGYQHKEEHNWNKFEDILNSLDKLIKSGKIRYIGLSNETAWGLSKFLEISKIKNLPRVMSVQNPYSLLNRTYEIGLAEVSIREESGLLAYSPLSFGYLTGKYRNGELPKNSRMKLFGDQFLRYKTKNGQLAIEKYHEIANKHELNFAQMSLKFCELQPFVTSVIIGATTMDQLKTDIESVNINLSEEVINEINEVQKIYPNPCP